MPRYSSRSCCGCSSQACSPSVPGRPLAQPRAEVPTAALDGRVCRSTRRQPKKCVGKLRALLYGAREVRGALDPGWLSDPVRGGVVVIDMDSRHIRLWNAVAEDLFGYTANEVIGQRLDVVIDDLPAELP